MCPLGDVCISPPLLHSCSGGPSIFLLPLRIPHALAHQFCFSKVGSSVTKLMTLTSRRSDSPQALATSKATSEEGPGAEPAASGTTRPDQSRSPLRPAPAAKSHCKKPQGLGLLSLHMRQSTPSSPSATACAPQWSLRRRAQPPRLAATEGGAGPHTVGLHRDITRTLVARGAL